MLFSLTVIVVLWEVTSILASNSLPIVYDIEVNLNNTNPQTANETGRYFSWRDPSLNETHFYVYSTELVADAGTYQDWPGAWDQCVNSGSRDGLDGCYLVFIDTEDEASFLHSFLFNMDDVSAGALWTSVGADGGLGIEQMLNDGNASNGFVWNDTAWNESIHGKCCRLRGKCCILVEESALD